MKKNIGILILLIFFAHYEEFIYHNIDPFLIV